MSLASDPLLMDDDAVDAWLLEALALSVPERASFLARIALEHPEAHEKLVALLLAFEAFDAKMLAGEMGAAVNLARAEAEISQTTAPRATLPRGTEESEVFPLPGWSRYRAGPFLGKGGMGKVFEAYDTQLQRKVALKFMLGDDPALTRRFIEEARAQARVDHNHVCTIHEVGEERGLPYIAMQWIEGQTPRPDDLSLSEKVLLIRRAAMGLGAAHRAGLVHRDIKPSNILYRRNEDGSLHPYLMDFGLARVVDHQQTVSGALMGTPLYMAPEQAQGKALDRRADIYSLGATLYFLLTGKTAVQGENTFEVIRNVVEADPIPPRQHDPNLPLDLEAVVLKCLEKKPEHRYASARALIEDLDAYLDGRPVTARRTGWWYRTRKRVARNRLAYGLGALALLAVLSAFAWAGYNRMVNLRRQQLVRDFSDRAAQLEAEAAQNALAPLHDVRPDQKRLRDQIDGLARDIASLGALAEGPGHYAMGRAYRVLGDLEEAQRQLQTSWAAGFQNGRVAYELARVSGSLYRQEREQVLLIKAPDQRQKAMAQLDLAYRQPALTWLQRAEVAERPQYLKAQIAYFEERYEDALALLEQLKPPPWFYEHLLLEGDIRKEQAVIARDQGDNARAHAFFEQGAAVIERAIRIGESVPGNYRALCKIYLNTVVTEIYSKGDVARPFALAEQALTQAFQADPDDWETQWLKNQLYYRLAEYHKNNDAAFDAVAQAMAAIEPLLLRRPDDAKILRAAGHTWRLCGEIHIQRAEDPRAYLQLARAAFARIRGAQRDYSSFNGLGLTYLAWGNYEKLHGGQPLAYWDQAADAFAAASALEPTLMGALINLGTTHMQRAKFCYGGQAQTALQKAQAALEQALKGNPSNYGAYFSLGQVQEELAKTYRDCGAAYLPYFEQARATYTQASQLNPSRLAADHSIAHVTHLLARGAWEQGQDPYPLLDEAQALEQELLDKAPNAAPLLNSLGNMWLSRAQFLAAEGNDPRSELNQAMARFEQASRLLPNHYSPQENMGSAQLELARYLAAQQLPEGQTLELAGAYLARAMELNPKAASVWWALGEQQRLVAERQMRVHQNPKTSLAKAKSNLEAALALEPEQPEYHLSMARLCLSAVRDQAQDADSWLEAGFEAELYAENGDRAQALLVKAALYLEVAKLDPEKRKQLQQQASTAAAQALALNSHLEMEWASLNLMGGEI